MKPNVHSYLCSWSDELVSRANRVRMLIGDAHWLSDGHHKELSGRMPPSTHPRSWRYGLYENEEKSLVQVGDQPRNTPDGLRKS